MSKILKKVFLSNEHECGSVYGVDLIV